MIKTKISVIGLGFVGLPLYLSLLEKKFKVIGIEKKSKIFKDKFKEIKDIKKPYFGNIKLDRLIKKNINKIEISLDYKKALNSDFIFICIPFHIDKSLRVNFEEYYKTLEQYYKKVKKDSVIILNSTVPPGFTNNILNIFKKKKIFRNDVSLVFSPERVEPGIKYYESITSSPRVFSTNNNIKISNKIKKLFLKIFNINKSQITEFNKYEEAEFCKVLENSYRAMNIAMIEEWGVLSETLGINIFQVIDAIKTRTTHSNIMRPGLGVGGYCLTKDPYFAKYSSKNFLQKKINFPFIDLAMKINLNMHNRSIQKISDIIKINKIKKTLIVGISYTADVNDLRNSRAIDLLKFLNKKKLSTSIYDTSIRKKIILQNKVINNKVQFKNFELIILINKNNNMKLNFSYLKKNTFVIDLNRILNNDQIVIIKKKTKNLIILGRGDL